MRKLLYTLLVLVAWVGEADDKAPNSAQATAPPGVGTVRVAGERRSSLEMVGTADDLILLERNTRALPPVTASPDEGTVAKHVAAMLVRNHYNRKPFDDTVSSRFLDRYLDTLDSQRFHFLETDVQEFEKYRYELDDLTMKGDTRAARDIFERFLRRVEERVAYVGELLKTEQFEFNGTDRYQFDREHSPRPKDLEEAKVLWRQHLRYEILQERLSAKPKAAAGADASTAAAATNAPAPSTVLGPNGVSEQIVKTITRRYARLLKTLRDFDGGDVFQYDLTSLTHVYDPHTDYLAHNSLENFAINMNLSLFGIGAVLMSEDGYCKVRELRPGPAMRSKKIKEGDRIVAVAQGAGEPVDVVDMKLNKVVELIRGPKGSEVRLTLIPLDAADPSVRREVALERDEIKLEDEEAKARILDLPGADGATNRIGLIDLPSFYSTINIATRLGAGHARSVTLDVARLLSKLKAEKVQGIILDLRRNGGGSLEEAIDLTGLFIKEGPVVQVKDSFGRLAVDKDTNSEVYYDGPLVVLTSRFSASASEILAGALQDYGRALIVGDSSTHGKGTVQSLVEMKPMLESRLTQPTNDPGALKLTIRKFYRASGASTQLRGVKPDIILPSINNFAEVGESSLDDPLPWDEIAGVPFEAENRIGSALTELRRRSEQRVAADQDFSYVREDVEEFKKHLSDRSVSLNESDRRREKEANEQRQEARQKERKARQEPADTVYEITLAQAELPGLPPPLVPTNQVSTASAAASVPAAHPEGGDDGEDDPKLAPADPNLKEAKRILFDLVELSGGKASLAKTK